MAHSFHNADKQTHRRVMVVGLLSCAAFVTISLLIKPQPENDHVLLKADGVIRTAGKLIPID